MSLPSIHKMLNQCWFNVCPPCYYDGVEVLPGFFVAGGGGGGGKVRAAITSSQLLQRIFLVTDLTLMQITQAAKRDDWTFF